MRSAVYFTRFEDNPGAGGGCRRFSQVIRALSSALSLDVLSTRNNDIYQEVCDFNLDKSDVKLWAESHSSVKRYLQFSKYWAKNIELLNYEIAFIDDPVYFKELILTLQEHRIPVVGFCHNLETLAYGQVTEGEETNALISELNTLKKLYRRLVKV